MNRGDGSTTLGRWEAADAKKGSLRGLASCGSAGLLNSPTVLPPLNLELAAGWPDGLAPNEHRNGTRFAIDLKDGYELPSPVD